MITGSTITDVVRGRPRIVTRSYTLDSPDPILLAYLTCKMSRNPADPILFTLGVNVVRSSAGAILSDGSDGVCAVEFDLSAAQTTSLPAGDPTFFEIVLVDAVQDYTVETGSFPTSEPLDPSH